MSGEGCGSCLGSLGEQYEFNDRLYVTQETDALGVVTAYTYDERGNVLTKKEAVGTSGRENYYLHLSPHLRSRGLYYKEQRGKPRAKHNDHLCL